MRRLTQLLAASPSSNYKAQWESTVSKYLAQERMRRGETLAAKLSRIVDRKDYVPVEKAFPQLSAPRFSGLAPQARQIESQPANPYTCTVAILGPPNAGKSSLINSLTTSHVNATSDRMGTTLRCLDSATHVGNTQLVLIDTPGLIVPAKGNYVKRERQENPHQAYEALDSIMRADTVVFAYSSEKMRLEHDDEGVLRRAADLAVRRELPLALVMTKHDMVRNKTPLMQERYRNLRRLIDQTGVKFSETFETSAKTHWGIIELKDALARYAKPGDWQYHRDEATLLLPPQRAGILISESISRFLIKANPREVQYRIVGWTPRSDHTEIYVELFTPSVYVLGQCYRCIKNVAEHCNSSISFTLNLRCVVIFHLMVTPGGIRRSD